MPAFTFEKLSPPAPPGAATPDIKKRRGFIGQMVDRLAEMRIRPLPRQEKAAMTPPQSQAED
jgi:hypothetical protein